MANPDLTAFPNGASSGDVTQTTAVVWTRAVNLGLLTFEIATDATFSHVVRSEQVAVTDGLVPVKVQFAHLNPGEEYFYRVVDATGHTIEGSFSTAAELGTHAGFDFAIASDEHAELAPFPRSRTSRLHMSTW